MRISVTTKIAAGYGMAMLLIAAMCASWYSSTSQVLATADRLNESRKVLHLLAATLAAVQDAETGQRGYLITGEDRYLGPYRAAAMRVTQSVRDVRTALARNERQLRRLNTLEGFIRERFTELQRIVTLREKTGFEAARDAVLTDKGKALMDDIRKTLGEMEEDANEVVRTSDEAARASASNARLLMISGSVAALVLLLVIVFTVTHHVAGPVKGLTQVADRIAAGDVAASVSANGRRDEIGQLTTAFARMSHALDEFARVAERIAAGDLSVTVTPQSDKDAFGKSFARMVENLRIVNQEVRDAVNVLASVAGEIVSTTTQVAAGAAETLSAISETTITVAEVKQATQLSSQKARQVSESTQKAAQFAATGKLSAEESLQGMSRIHQQTESIAESIVKLSEQSQTIAEIISSVNDLAEQSNLLAVNAAIEAAKAGDYGKGFGVVAAEVKSLATQSKQATAQVRAILNDVQKAVAAAVMATERGSKAVASGVKLAADAGESIRVLADSNAAAAQAATQIAASSHEQALGMDQVAMAMESIKQASAQNAAGIRQAEVAAQNLNDVGLRLKRAVEHYRV